MNDKDLAQPTSGESTSESNSESTAQRETWLSEELLGERTEILIKHGSETYRLRRTRQDKLILYK